MAAHQTSSATQCSRSRAIAKRVAPPGAVAAIHWRRDIWSDLRLRLLTEVGKIPSHAVRNYFYRRSGVRLDRTSSIHWRAEFYAPERLEIGAHSIVGFNAFFDAREGLKIGENVNVGSWVAIYTRQHDIDDPLFAESGGPVTICDRVYLASWCRILPGVTVGEGAVVALGAVVTKDVAPYTLVAGIPAKYVRDRSRDLNYELGYAKRFV